MSYKGSAMGASDKPSKGGGIMGTNYNIHKTPNDARVVQHLKTYSRNFTLKNSRKK